MFENKEELNTGWLTPWGEFIQANSYEHLSSARTLLYNIYGEKNDSTPDFALLRKGWISISLSLMWRKEWRIAWHKPPTPEQINFVETYFESDIPVDDFCAERWNREVRE